MFPSFAVSSLTPADSENNKERRSIPYIKKDTQSSVFYKNGDGNAEPKNGLNERNVSLLTDCSASETFFDEVKALHCFQRK